MGDPQTCPSVPWGVFSKLSHVPRVLQVNKLLEVGGQSQLALSTLPLHLPVLVPSLAAATEGPNSCDTIYQGFAECLIRLGDGMGQGIELETVCRYRQVGGSGQMGGSGNPVHATCRA